MTSARREQVAHGIADALLAGAWEPAQMRRRLTSALGRSRAPEWARELVAQVLDAYRDPPADRPRELGAFVQACPAWEKSWRARRQPHIAARAISLTAMARRRWPVAELDDIAALCELLGVGTGELDWFADVRGLERRAPEPLRHYRWRALPRRGGVRLVAAPKPRLKALQRQLLRDVIGLIPVHGVAHGCVPGRSVRSALAPHARSTVVIRADLEAFFPSVPAGRVWGLLRMAGLPEAVAYSITGLVTTVVPLDVWRAVPRGADAGAHFRTGRRLARPHLPQGAPTSPALANLVAYSLDRRLAGLASSFGARYTRYVDDLIFSMGAPPAASMSRRSGGGPSLRAARSRFVDLIDQIVRAQGFRLNERKTVVLGASGRQQLLGAVVNDHPTLPRRERDNLRALLHNCAVRGWSSQARGSDRETFRAHLLGRVSWAAGLDAGFGARVRAIFDEIDWS